MKKTIIMMALCSLTACAGGKEEAMAMPTPVLCKTILDLGPSYLRYDEYLEELKTRKNDCGKYLGDSKNIRIR